MTGGRRMIAVTAALAAVTALLLSLTIRPPAGLSFLLGSILGAASLGAVTMRVRLITQGRGQGNRYWRVLTALLAIPYYLALAVGLWAVGTYYPGEAPWLLGGYLLVLAAFAATMGWSVRSLKKPL